MELNTIYNMDCLEGMKQMEDNSVDLIVTDPPYNIGDKNKLTKVGNDFVTNEEAWGEWDKMDDKEYLTWIEKIMKEFNRVLKERGSCIMFVDKFNITYFRDFGKNLNWHPVNFYALIKRNPVPNLRKNGFTSGFELGIIFNKNKKERTWNFLRQNLMQNYITYNIGNKETTHPTEKPLKAFERLIKIHTNENDLVLDCFMGSGTTALACLKLSRKFIGFELNEEFVNMANKRISGWQEQTTLPHL